MRYLLISLIALWPAMVPAHDYRLGDLVIFHPKALEPSPSAQAGAGYFSITNNSERDDYLMAVTADFPQVTLHETVMKDDIAAMARRDRITIPAGQTVTLEPGGMHVMFMGLRDRPFVAGNVFEATLKFANAGDITVIFKIEERSEAATDIDHSGH